jgi:hypothetical protein
MTYFCCCYNNKYKKYNKINIQVDSHTTNVIFVALDNGTEPFVRVSDSHMAGFIVRTSRFSRAVSASRACATSAAQCRKELSASAPDPHACWNRCENINNSTLFNEARNWNIANKSLYKIQKKICFIQPHPNIAE